MKRFLTAALALFIALVFLAYMVTYTVPYDQTVVITRFGKADAQKAVVREPGLKFKLPWPIDRVQSYPKQVQVLEDYPEEIQLPDGNTVIVNMSVSWRIDNPLDFYRSLQSIKGSGGANEALRTQMSNLRSVVAQYNFDQLVNPDAEKVRMADLEDEVRSRFQEQLDAIQPSYGIVIERVSMGRLLYTESTAEKVNLRMTATQEARAGTIQAEGAAQAGTITSEATAASEIILGFAQQVADQIRTVGDKEVAVQMARYAGNEDFAIFLRQIEAAEQIIQNRSTLIIDASLINPFNVYLTGPGEPGNLSRTGGQALPAARRPTPLLPEASAQGPREAQP